MRIAAPALREEALRVPGGNQLYAHPPGSRGTEWSDHKMICFDLPCLLQGKSSGRTKATGSRSFAS
eukprot:1514542-Pyramimonas_sp.AAC.1